MTLSFTKLVLLLSSLCYLQPADSLSVEDLPETPEDGELWVLLVAGSNGWFNYRHQADVCHAYQIVHAHGVPDDHIIVMMYDDIAYNKENPTPGKIINHPNGTDVYHGVPKDYVCGSVRPDIFLQVLKGEKVDGAFGTGKTLNSGPKDNVFASFACYFDKARKTFLGDVYSIKWLEDSDKENIEKETLEDQYKIVKKETNTSMVCQFGDMSISKLPVGTFQGEKATIGLPRPPPTPHYPPSWFSCGADAVPGPEVPVKILQSNIENAATAEEKKDAKMKLDELMRNRKFMENIVHNLVQVVTNDIDVTNTIFTDNVELTQFDCYYAAIDMFHDKCFNVGKNDYALRMLNTFVNLCEKNFDIATISGAIQAVCNHPHVYGIH